MTSGSAWYESDRETFVRESTEIVVDRLASAAGAQGLHIEPEQHQEWQSSVGLLQEQLRHRLGDVQLLRTTLASAALADYEHVILEYDFRRRGLRMDCVLLGRGIIAVIEFKRSKPTAADRDQATNYCINLVEFHEHTRRACETERCIVVPIVTRTLGHQDPVVPVPSAFQRPPWESVVRDPLICDAATLHEALHAALLARRNTLPINRAQWLAARFAPSSTILDAAISLYGKHDVSAIAAHAAPIEMIDRCTEEVAECIVRSKRDKQNRIVFVSGAPGAGKTLVGLKLAFDSRFRDEAVFVTGNAPLVEVLREALEGSYRSQQSGRRRDGSGLITTGYAHEDAHRVIGMSTFKIAKAHAFLGERGAKIGSTDGSVVVFDEAQRTYEKGREVLRKKLEDNEADLILASLEHYRSGAVVVALIGHNQAINRGEMGIVAWFAAASARGWRYAISDETLKLSEVANSGTWADHPSRERLRNGHLPHSLRYYRNGDIERWAARVLGDEAAEAAILATDLDARGDSVWLVRDISEAKSWARSRRVGDERAGLIASGQARRLAAEGLFVELKPDIAKWMLAASGDIRSSNMLETVQNQYQIQGLEIDYSVVCWDADLRRDDGRWASYKISGAGWQADKGLDIAKNGYRVLLTQARKGMMLFVPRGDTSGVDDTRRPCFYDDIADYLVSCGARLYMPEAIGDTQST